MERRVEVRVRRVLLCADRSTPGRQLALQRRGPAGLARRKVLHLARVLAEIEQLHAPIFIVLDQFPITLAYRAAGAAALIRIVREVPKQGAGRWLAGAGQQTGEARAVKAARRPNADEFEE